MVTGIAAGFGYNRSLTLPTLDPLPEFPLIAAAMGTSSELAKAQEFAGRSGRAENDGQLRLSGTRRELAGGGYSSFTSFKILDSFALLTVSFGNRFEIALLGLSSLTMPPLTPPDKRSVLPNWRWRRRMHLRTAC